jgi:hypothetical protein
MTQKVMPLAAARRGDAPAAVPTLGPGVVVSARSERIEVELEGGARVPVEGALPLPYEVVDGDVLLVIGQGGRHYAIGVIAAQGRTTFALQGDVSIRAVDGALDLCGDRGVRITGPEVDVSTGTLRTVARATIQAFETFTQRVASLLSVHAGQSHTVVEGESLTMAKTASIQADDAVTVNGKEILLG